MRRLLQTARRLAPPAVLMGCAMAAWRFGLPWPVQALFVMWAVLTMLVVWP